jgi:hypothetical protein
LVEKENPGDRPSTDKRTGDRRKAQDPLYAGEERRKGERRKSES